MSADSKGAENKASSEFKTMVSLIPKESLVDIICALAAENEEIKKKIYNRISKDPSRCKVFVRSLAWETTSEALEKHFSQYGEVTEAVVLMDRNTQKSRGYGFVNFKNAASAGLALRNPTKMIDGRHVYCNLAAAGNPNKRQMISPAAAGYIGQKMTAPSATGYTGQKRPFETSLPQSGAIGARGPMPYPQNSMPMFPPQLSGVHHVPQSMPPRSYPQLPVPSPNVPIQTPKPTLHQPHMQHAVRPNVVRGAYPPAHPPPQLQSSWSTSGEGYPAKPSNSLPTNFRPGDWICQMCGNHNYKDKRSCHRCGAQRPALDASQNSNKIAAYAGAR
mmetsp:Transcript_2425/g.3487  ORF Transcript_2425/g.3487 Transcript_2425/m.3487 type:complete len:332 (+) Transcript_2425:42-1037(+)